jgi:hypothetical protein
MRTAIYARVFTPRRAHDRNTYQKVSSLDS